MLGSLTHTSGKTPWDLKQNGRPAVLSVPRTTKLHTAPVMAEYQRLVVARQRAQDGQQGVADRCRRWCELVEHRRQVVVQRTLHAKAGKRAGAGQSTGRRIATCCFISRRWICRRAYHRKPSLRRSVTLLGRFNSMCAVVGHAVIISQPSLPNSFSRFSIAACGIELSCMGSILYSHCIRPSPGRARANLSPS